jgi:undecaprenyl-diphosphatase
MMAKRAPRHDAHVPVEEAERAVRLVEQEVQRERQPWWALRRRGHIVWIVHLALLALFAVLAAIAHTLRADRPDVWATGHLQRLSGLDGLLTAVSWIGYAPHDVFVYGAIILGAFLVGLRMDAICLLGAVLGAGALDQIVKQLVARPRPSAPAVHVLGHVGGYSFPSGHVLSYVAFFGLLAYVAWVRLRPSPPRAAAIAICLVLLTLVGPSRVYLGAHWTSDVIGAYLLGGLWLSLMLRLYVTWLDRLAAQPAARATWRRVLQVPD